MWAGPRDLLLMSRLWWKSRRLGNEKTGFFLAHLLCSLASLTEASFLIVNCPVERPCVKELRVASSKQPMRNWVPRFSYPWGNASCQWQWLSWKADPSLLPSLPTLLSLELRSQLWPLPWLQSFKGRWTREPSQDVAEFLSNRNLWYNR